MSKYRANVLHEQAFWISPRSPKKQPLREGGLPRAGSPALWPVSALRLPQPGSAEARPAASRPSWKRRNTARWVWAPLSAVRAFAGLAAFSAAAAGRAVNPAAAEAAVP